MVDDIFWTGDTIQHTPEHMHPLHSVVLVVSDHVGNFAFMRANAKGACCSPDQISFYCTLLSSFRTLLPIIHDCIRLSPQHCVCSFLPI